VGRDVAGCFEHQTDVRAEARMRRLAHFTRTFKALAFSLDTGYVPECLDPEVR
jgi:hypothetical protein